MKKSLLFLVLLHTMISFSQENIFGDSPIEGVVPIKRTETENSLNVTNTVLSQSSATPPPANPTGNSNEVGVTTGQLSVSLTGGAVYDVPIAVPPGINGVVPQISLSYNSQASNGLAGYGWNIMGISVITRIPSTKFHDGAIDAVDFDGLDRFSLDGQRLIIKNGTSGVYGAAGTIYETESFSNIKVTSYGVHPSGSNYGPSYFKVEYPDGSSAIYGNGSNSRSRNDWAITYWQNPQGVRISYTYSLSNNNLSISTIKYGSRLTTTPVNEISFIYKTRQRPEQAYIGGQNFIRNTILSEIKVKGNNVDFRNYLLAHEPTSLGYEILKSITERSGDNTKSLNPTVFEYDITEDDVSYNNDSTILNSISNVRSTNHAIMSGDFNGDGNIDLILYPTIGADAKKKLWLFDNIQQGGNNAGNYYFVGQFIDIFPTSWLNEQEILMNRQGFAVIQYNSNNNITSFKNYSKTESTIDIEYELDYEFPKLLYTVGCSNLPHCSFNPFPDDSGQIINSFGEKSEIILDPFPGNNPGGSNTNCPNPTNINLSQILNNQATLTWNQAGSPLPVMWEVHYFETGLGSNPSNNDPVGTYTTVNQNSLIINNLIARKNYTFFVRSICFSSPNNVASNWVGPYNSGGLIVNPGETRYQTIPKEFVSGDFNGDGITDVIAIDKTTGYETRVCQSSCYTTTYTSVPGGNTYFVNLDSRLTNNFVKYSGHITTTNNSQFLVADFNGDGKSDLFVFDTGVCSIYTLNDNNTFVNIGSINNSNIKLSHPILMGDYNGDGKADFIIPKGLAEYVFYTFLSTGLKGTSFIVSTDTHPFNYVPYEQKRYGVQTISQLIPQDFNSDGKTDIISLTVQSDDNRPQSILKYLSTTFYANMGGNNFEMVKQAISPTLPALKEYSIPVFLNYKHGNNFYKQSDLCVVSDNKIYSFTYKKNNIIDTQLKSVTLGNGLKKAVTYSPLINNYIGSFDTTIYQSSLYSDVYPNISINVATSYNIVTKIEDLSDNQSKKQLYRYYGAVSNAEGLGFLGFRELHKTNWFNENSQAITTVTKHDITKRGAVSETYSIQSTSSPLNYIPTNYITRTSMTYEDELLPNKVYKIKNTESKVYNSLEGSSKKVLTVYDNFNNPLSIKLSVYSHPTLHGRYINLEDTTTIEYDNNTTGVGTYYIGRPKKTVTNLDGFKLNLGTGTPFIDDTQTSEELYTYNSAQLLTKVQKKANDTNYLIEDNVYDIFGNITKKTITANNLIPRVTEYTYDTSGRFLLTAKDIEGLVTTYSYNTSNGSLLSETLPHNSGYPLTTTFEYDVWNRTIKVTDYLGKKVTTNYSLYGNGTTISNISDDGTTLIEVYNQLGKNVLQTTKDISNRWIHKAFEYDDLGYLIKESEPSLGPTNNPYHTNISQWNTTSYDIYGRVTQQTLYTGKTTNITYNGLTTTSDDGVKTTTVTKNAVGNITSLTDNGGTITYKYYADGNLKESDYGGIIVSIEQDGWGRKTKLTDPSAGIYTYEYNDFGELTKETTPNGTTTYTFDNYGKVTSKSISGTNTDSQFTYTYNPTTKLLTGMLHIDSSESSETIYTSYTYGYDDYKRLNITEESSGTAFFQKMFYFDSFGRLDLEYSRAVNVSDMKTSENVVKNTYKNGYHWQILDYETNQVLWQTNTTNAKGQLTGGQFGNGVIVTNTYDQYGLPTLIKHQKTGGVNPINMQLGTTFDAQKGNLMSRTNNLFTWSENFQYDDMNRLTHYKNASGNLVEQMYDNRGRITENSLGDYEYFNNSYRNKAIDLNAESEAYYKLREGVFFDTMESQSGWNIINYPGSITYDTTFSHQDIGGTTSLKIVNNSSSQEIVVQSEVWIPINNSQPTQYTYSGWIYSNGPQVELFLLMKDANETGYMTIADNVVSNTTGQWKYVEKTFTVPANIRYINFRVDNNGKKNGGTTTWFDNVKIRKTGNPPTYPNNDRHLDISYNTFKAPVDIFEPGIERLSFRYNAFGQRSTMFYGGLQENKKQRPLRKHYSADGSMEFKQNIQTGEVEFITYIGGDGYSAPVVLKSNGTSQEYLYLHRDYQGTIIAISNQAGQVEEKRLFDAWGNVLKVQDGTGRILSGFLVLDRGYTGHEHLQAINIIHMNGRLYDPVIHRFLQPDNFIQDPFNTQNFNRYGYCLNNPFMYTDPSGEFWFVAVGFVVGAYIGASIQQGTFDPGKWNSSWWKGAVVGGIVGAYGGQLLATTLATSAAASGASVSIASYGGVSNHTVFAKSLLASGKSIIKSYSGDILKNSLPSLLGNGKFVLDITPNFDKLLKDGIKGGISNVISQGLDIIYDGGKEGAVPTGLLSDKKWAGELSRNFLDNTLGGISGNIINGNKGVFEDLTYLKFGGGLIEFGEGKKVFNASKITTHASGWAMYGLTSALGFGKTPKFNPYRLNFNYKTNNNNFGEHLSNLYWSPLSNSGKAYTIGAGIGMGGLILLGSEIKYK